MHGFRRILVVGALALTLPLAARAQCPPTPDFFDIWTWSPSSQTGDDWITADVCSSGARRQSITNRVITHMGLDENWDYWDDGFLSSTNVCNPDRWGARVVNGAYAGPNGGAQQHEHKHTMSDEASAMLGEVLGSLRGL